VTLPHNVPYLILHQPFIMDLCLIGIVRGKKDGKSGGQTRRHGKYGQISSYLTTPTTLNMAFRSGSWIIAPRTWLTISVDAGIAPFA